MAIYAITNNPVHYTYAQKSTKVEVVPNGGSIVSIGFQLEKDSDTQFLQMSENFVASNNTGHMTVRNNAPSSPSSFVQWWVTVVYEASSQPLLPTVTYTDF